MLRTARILLERAGDGSGLKLTGTGNLSRSVVAEMIQIIEWADFDKATVFELNKVINEPDFLPVHFVRLLLQATKLVRETRDSLSPTRLGRKMLAAERQGALQAFPFHLTFWPESDVGIVLWSLPHLPTTGFVRTS